MPRYHRHRCPWECKGGVTIPWEITEEYIRSGHKDKHQYETCRTVTGELWEKRGIKQIYCKKKGSENWETQSYLFSKERGWTMSKAKAWFKSHKNMTLNYLHIHVDKDKVQVTKYYTSAPVTLTKEGVMNGLYKPAAAIKELGEQPITSLPVVFDHPAGTMHDPEIHDPKLIIGITNDLHVGKSKGDIAYQGMMHIMNIEETKVHRAAMVNGDPLGVSIGYFLNLQEGAGNFKGVEYDGVESWISPRHLGLMDEMSPACTIDDGCGVGVSSAQALLMGGNRGVEHLNAEVSKMADEDVSKLTIEQLVEKNDCVKTLQEEHKTKDEELQEKEKELKALNAKLKELTDAAATAANGADGLQKELNEIKAKMPVLEAAAKELNAMKAAEKEARVDSIIERAPKDSLKKEDLLKMGDTELASIEAVLPKAEPREHVGGAGSHSTEDPMGPLGISADRYSGLKLGEVNTK